MTTFCVGKATNFIIQSKIHPNCSTIKTCRQIFSSFHIRYQRYDVIFTSTDIIERHEWQGFSKYRCIEYFIQMTYHCNGSNLSRVWELRLSHLAKRTEASEVSYPFFREWPWRKLLRARPRLGDRQLKELLLQVFVGRWTMQTAGSLKLQPKTRNIYIYIYINIY